MSAERPRLAIFKFASCDGCQVSFLNLVDELLELAQRFDIAFFRELTSRADDGPYDVALVEGSVTTARDVERIRAIRERSRVLIAIGACAASGGIQALRNLHDVAAWKAEVYPHPEQLDVLPTSTPISDHVRVDHALQGCPIDRDQLLRVLTRSLLGAKPDTPQGSVCLECKRAGHACVLVTRALPCMGPVTRAGCGAICPGQGRECYACFGPSDDPNPDALARQFAATGLSRADIARRLRHINGWREEFREAAERVEAGS